MLASKFSDPLSTFLERDPNPRIIAGHKIPQYGRFLPNAEPLFCFKKIIDDPAAHTVARNRGPYLVSLDTAILALQLTGSEKHEG